MGWEEAPALLPHSQLFLHELNPNVPKEAWALPSISSAGALSETRVSQTPYKLTPWVFVIAPMVLSSTPLFSIYWGRKSQHV